MWRKKSGKIFFIIFLAFFMLVSTCFISTGAIFKTKISEENNDFSKIKLEYCFKKPIISEIKINQETYSQIILPDYEQYFKNFGEPVIPTIPIKILIPFEGELDEINVIEKDNIVIDIKNPIEPAQAPIPLNDKLNNFEFVPPDLSIYESDRLFPDKNYEIVTTQLFRGYKILFLNLFPIKYYPEKNQLIFSPKLVIDINFKKISDNQFNENINFRGISEDFEKVISYIDNPEALKTYPSELTLDSYEYVIITTESFKEIQGEYDFQTLAQSRTDRSLNAKIVTLEEIKSDYQGVDNQEKIRNFIIDAYNNWQTKYILLGGDLEQIPARKLWVQSWEGGYTVNMPSDLYYGCLDGDFNYDQDSNWGEPRDGINGGDVDLLAEVYVGRATVDNAAEIENFVKKTIEYETTQDPYWKKALLVGEFLGFGGDAQYAYKMKNQCVGICNADGYTTIGIPSDQYVVDTLFEHDYEWDKFDLINILNQNTPCIINHLGHGNVNYAMKLYNSDIDQLTNNNYFFVYSQTCLAGSFDQGDCAAEHFTSDNPNGAFAVIMNARYGWGKRSSTDGPSQRFDREFYDAIFNEGKSYLSVANQDSKEDNIYRINEPCMRWCAYGLNLFGDPAIKVKGTGPVLSYSENSYDFGRMRQQETATTSFEIWNSGNDKLTYSLSCVENWISINPNSGESTGEHDLITITIDTTGLANGTHICSLVIDSDGGNANFVITVRIGPSYASEPSEFDFGWMEIGETASTNFEIWNSGLDLLEYSISTKASWISYSPVSGVSNGEHDTIIIDINTSNLPNGSHTGNIIINTNCGEYTFPVTVMVGTVLMFEPKSFYFGVLDTNEEIKTSFDIWNPGIGILDYSMSTGTKYVKTDPNNGKVNSAEKHKIDLTINPKGLTQGYYYYNINIRSNGGDRKIPVEFDLLYTIEALKIEGYLDTEAIDGPLDNLSGILSDEEYKEIWNVDKSDNVLDTQSVIEIGQSWELYLNEYNQVFNIWKIYRGYLFFDTSSLPDVAEIKSACIKIYGKEEPNPKDFEQFDIVVQNGQPNNPHAPLEDIDYNRLNYQQNGGKLPISDYKVDSYNTIHLNENGISWINPEGITKICLRTSRDIDGNAPDNHGEWIKRVTNTIKISTSETFNKPKLCIAFKSNDDGKSIDNNDSSFNNPIFYKLKLFFHELLKTVYGIFNNINSFKK